jgi:hypothetical protein
MQLIIFGLPRFPGPIYPRFMLNVVFPLPRFVALHAHPLMIV